VIKNKYCRGALIAVGVLATSTAAWAQKAGETNPDWKTLDVGMIATGGIRMVSLMPGQTFSYQTGQAFTPDTAIDCTNFTPAAAEYVLALKAGAKVVKIEVAASAPTPEIPPPETHPRAGRARSSVAAPAPAPSLYYGVLALCKIHKSAEGPASRAYNVQVPAQFLEKARDGFVSVVGEKVAVARYSWETPTQRQAKFSDLFKVSVNQGRTGQQTGAVQEDFSWILWLTDRAPTFTEALPSVPPAAQH